MASSVLGNSERGGRRYRLRELLRMGEVAKRMPLTKLNLSKSASMELVLKGNSRPWNAIYSLFSGSFEKDTHTWSNIVQKPCGIYPDQSPKTPKTPSEPARPIQQQDQGIPREKIFGFAQFIRSHSSPRSHRVTAGGRIVPAEPNMPPPTFHRDFLNDFVGPPGDVGAIGITTDPQPIIHPKLHSGIHPTYKIIKVLDEGKSALVVIGRTILRFYLRGDDEVAFETVSQPERPTSRIESSFGAGPRQTYDAYHQTQNFPPAHSGNALGPKSSTAYPFLPAPGRSAITPLQGRSGFTNREVEIYEAPPDPLGVERRLTNLAGHVSGRGQNYPAPLERRQTFVDPAIIKASYPIPMTNQPLQSHEWVSSVAARGQVGHFPQLDTMPSARHHRSTPDLQKRTSEQPIEDEIANLEQFIGQKSYQLRDIERALCFEHILSRPEVERLAGEKHKLVMLIDQLRQARDDLETRGGNPYLRASASNKSMNPQLSRGAGYAENLDSQALEKYGANGLIPTVQKPLSPLAPTFTPVSLAYAAQPDMQISSGNIGEAETNMPFLAQDPTLIQSVDGKYEGSKRSYTSEARIGPFSGVNPLTAGNQASISMISKPTATHARVDSTSEILRTMLHAREGSTQGNEKPTKPSFTWNRFEGESKEDYEKRCSHQRQIQALHEHIGPRFASENENAPITPDIRVQEESKIAGYKSPTSVAASLHNAPGMVSKLTTSGREALMANARVPETTPSVNMRGGRQYYSVPYRGRFRPNYSERKTPRPQIFQNVVSRPPNYFSSVPRAYNPAQGPMTGSSSARPGTGYNTMQRPAAPANYVNQGARQNPRDRTVIENASNKAALGVKGTTLNKDVHKAEDVFTSSSNATKALAQRAGVPEEVWKMTRALFSPGKINSKPINEWNRRLSETEFGTLDPSPPPASDDAPKDMSVMQWARSLISPTSYSRANDKSTDEDKARRASLCESYHEHQAEEEQQRREVQERQLRGPEEELLEKATSMKRAERHNAKFTFP